MWHVGVWLIHFAVFLVLLILVDLVERGMLNGLMVRVALFVFYGTGAWMWWCVSVKRFHDRGKSAWWMLIFLVPLLAWWMVDSKLVLWMFENFIPVSVWWMLGINIHNGSVWWTLDNLIPSLTWSWEINLILIIGPIWGFVESGFLKGDPVGNRYGLLG